MTRPARGKAARNEDRKLVSTTYNAGGLAIFGVGGLTPAVQGALTRHDLIAFAAFLAIFVFLHLQARRVLRGLED